MENYNQIKKMVRQIIKEELSIAKTVEDKSVQIKNQILNDMQNVDWITKNRLRNVQIKRNSFRTNVFDDLNLPVNYIQYECFKFQNLEQYQQYYQFFDIESNVGNDFMLISFVMIGDDILTSSFESSIYHEVEHIYQKFKSSTNLTDGIYQKALQYLDNNDNEYLNTLAWLTYLTTQFEIDANLNGLYPYIVQKKYKTADDIVNCPYVQQLLQNIDFFYKKMMSWPINNDSLKAFKEFGKPRWWFTKRYKNSIKRFKEKIPKIAAKFLINENIFFDEIKNKTSYKFGEYVL